MCFCRKNYDSLNHLLQNLNNGVVFIVTLMSDAYPYLNGIISTVFLCLKQECIAFERVIDLLDTGDGVDLRHLTGHLRVVYRVHRVLVIELCDQQLEEAVL